MAQPSLCFQEVASNDDVNIFADEISEKMAKCTIYSAVAINKTNIMCHETISKLIIKATSFTILYVDNQYYSYEQIMMIAEKIDTDTYVVPIIYPYIRRYMPVQLISDDENAQLITEEVLFSISFNMEIIDDRIPDIIPTFTYRFLTSDQKEIELPVGNFTVDHILISPPIEHVTVTAHGIIVAEGDKNLFTKILPALHKKECNGAMYIPLKNFCCKRIKDFILTQKTDEKINIAICTRNTNHSMEYAYREMKESYLKIWGRSVPKKEVNEIVDRDDS